MKNIILIFKGFLIGISNIIPGVSGGTMAVGLNIYEDLLKAISKFQKNIKKNVNFLGMILIGMAVAIILGSNVMIYLLEHYEVAVTCLFIGLILGGIPAILDQSKIKLDFKNIFSFLFFFVGFLLFSSMSKEASLVDLKNLTIIGSVLLFLVGIIASGSMVIPGVSGSFVLVLLGYYKPILEAIKEFFSFVNLMDNFIVLMIFGIGVLVGIFLITKAMLFLFKKNKQATYSAILGIVLSSIIILIMPLLNVEMPFYKALISFLLVDVGFIIAYMLGDK